MRNLKLKIAGYNILFKTSHDGTEIAVSNKFLGYISRDIEFDISIIIHPTGFELPENAEKVFHAPYVEEIDGHLISGDPEFWSVWRDDSSLYIKTRFPPFSEKREGLLKLSLSEKEWHLSMSGNIGRIDPMEYPLDGLILYYLTAVKKDIMIHASGINFDGRGYLFSGISGTGKSTMARLWHEHGARIIHDDRLIIRKSGNGYRMFNTPVYDSDIPVESELGEIYIIEHGNGNKPNRLRGADAVSQVMANCIQHTWNTDLISGLLGSVSEMCRIIPIFRLQFRPDSDVIHEILKKNEEPR